MRRALAVAASAAVLASLVSPAPARAEGFDERGGQRPGIDRARPAGPPPTAVRPFDPRFDSLKPAPALPSELSSHAFPPPRSFPKHPSSPGHHPGFADRGFKGHGSGSVFVGSGPVIYSPGYVDSGPVYADPPLYATPAYAPTTSVAVAPAPPPPPSPTVVEHETGRYELRGDGLSVPHTWVWVPNPPAAPPEVAAPASPPPADTASRRSALYTWTDRDGVVHWTDNANSVPPEYRSKVQKRSL